jgi:hypothetical protein
VDHQTAEDKLTVEDGCVVIATNRELEAERYDEMAKAP